mmetsp:Transcript_71830/g.226943  ORF Transcript_71830/g.226943 Transcript_71830/m.226943 type:complete len:201 (+) Transcript_71830:117-719(+)
MSFRQLGSDGLPLRSGASCSSMGGAFASSARTAAAAEALAARMAASTCSRAVSRTAVSTGSMSGGGGGPRLAGSSLRTRRISSNSLEEAWRCAADSALISERSSATMQLTACTRSSLSWFRPSTTTTRFPGDLEPSVGRAATTGSATRLAGLAVASWGGPDLPHGVWKVSRRCQLCRPSLNFEIFKVLSVVSLSPGEGSA